MKTLEQYARDAVGDRYPALRARVMVVLEIAIDAAVQEALAAERKIWETRMQRIASALQVGGR